ncbi:transient receptor potential cation channel protein painless-like [Malaya genurostris]|uniref:transient receptor potential cation channel protein painless-like n=1 Tax=Malaya genurostris TaxID=325434 RepID=UPI0026F3AFDD|nr:transient receptor potential cation channel protein painless-like [Malaya genurostris]
MFSRLCDCVRNRTQTAPTQSVGIETGKSEKTIAEKRVEKRNLSKKIKNKLEEIINEFPVENSLQKLQDLLDDSDIKTLRDLIKDLEKWNAGNTIPEPKSFLHTAKLQRSFAIMLKKNIKYQSLLEAFITHFDAVNESVIPDLDTPLHYAVKALNVDFIKWLLEQPNVAINSRNNQRKTALFLLCEQYKVNNLKIEKLRECILLLLEHKADFNICSDLQQLPFDLLIRNSNDNEEFIRKCLELIPTAVAISDRRIVSFFQCCAPVTVTVELLEIYLRFGETEKFLREMKKFDVNQYNVEAVIKLLLHKGVELNMGSCVSTIIEKAGKTIFQVEKTRNSSDVDALANSTDVNTNRLPLKGLLRKACEAGNVTTLRLLLNRITDRVLINDDPILVITLNRANESCNHTEQRSRMLQCADLLSNDQRVHISSTDNYGNTALHLAVKFGFSDIALVLLKNKHAFLGTRNKDGLTPLDYGRYDFWKKYFDQCITIDVKRANYDRSDVWFNLNGFSPYMLKKQKLTKKEKHQKTAASLPKDSNNLWWIVMKPMAKNNTQSKLDTTNTFSGTEIAPVEIISKSKDLIPLLLHPVVYTFIKVKWQSMAKWHYINLFCTLLTMISFGSYSENACDDGGASVISTFFSWLGALCMICREVLQISFMRKNYLYSLNKYLDIVIIIFMLIVLMSGCNSILSSLAVIVLAVKFNVIISSLSFNILSTWMYMFITVTVNFLKYLLFFSFPLFAFVFCFFVIYKDGNQTPKALISQQNTSFNQFSTFSYAALKTLVMTTGEFDAADIDFSDGKYIVFVLFVIFVSIVFANFLNGVAVSDITVIRNESELISVGRKVFVLDRYERGLENIKWNDLRRLFPSPFFKEHSDRIAVKPKELRKILVQRIDKSIVFQQEGILKQSEQKKIRNNRWRLIRNILRLCRSKQPFSRTATVIEVPQDREQIVEQEQKVKGNNRFSINRWIRNTLGRRNNDPSVEQPLCQPNNEPPVSQQQDEKTRKFKFSKTEWKVVPLIPWLTANIKLLEFPLSLTLEGHIMDEALRITDRSIMAEDNGKPNELLLEMDKVIEPITSDKKLLVTAQTAKRAIKIVRGG